MNQTNQTNQAVQKSIVGVVPLRPGFSFGGCLSRLIPLELSDWDRLPNPSVQPGSDAAWMLDALGEAMRGIGIANPNPAVGCVVVAPNGEKIASGFTQAYGGAHAERVALQTGALVPGSTVYVTLEPCSHFGKQPPCVSLLLDPKIQRVVISRRDSNPIVSGEGIRQLRQAGKILSLGVFSNETTAWNFPFFAYQKVKRPIFVLKWAQTLDGQLADDAHCSQWISNPLARAYAHGLRQHYDAILVGARTVLKDFPRLNVRDCTLPHQSEPLSIVFDPQGLIFDADLSAQEKLLRTTFRSDVEKKRNVIILTLSAAIKKRKAVWVEHFSHIHLGTLTGDDLLPEMISFLSGSVVESLLGHALQSVFVEGGAKTLTTFLKAGLADLLHAFIAPRLTGGREHRLFTGNLLNQSHSYSLLNTTQLGSNVLLEMIAPQYLDIFNTPKD